MLPNLRRGIGGGSGVIIARITRPPANTPTSAGIGSMPPRRSVRPKVKRGTPPGFDADAGDQQAEQHARDRLHRRGARDQRRAHQAEERQPEIFEGREVQRDSASGGARTISESVPAIPPSAEPEAGAERQLRLALAGHRVGLVRIGRRGRRAGDAQQRTGDVAGEDRHRGGRHDGGDRGDRREIEGDRHEERRRHGGGQAGQRADDEAVDGRAASIATMTSQVAISRKASIN